MIVFDYYDDDDDDCVFPSRWQHSKVPGCHNFEPDRSLAKIFPLGNENTPPWIIVWIKMMIYIINDNVRTLSKKHPMSAKEAIIISGQWHSFLPCMIECEKVVLVRTDGPSLTGSDDFHLSVSYRLLQRSILELWCGVPYHLLQGSNYIRKSLPGDNSTKKLFSSHLCFSRVFCCSSVRCRLSVQSVKTYIWISFFYILYCIDLYSGVSVIVRRCCVARFPPASTQ